MSGQTDTLAVDRVRAGDCDVSGPGTWHGLGDTGLTVHRDGEGVQPVSRW